MAMGCYCYCHCYYYHYHCATASYHYCYFSDFCDHFSSVATVIASHRLGEWPSPSAQQPAANTADTLRNVKQFYKILIRNPPREETIQTTTVYHY